MWSKWPIDTALPIVAVDFAGLDGSLLLRCALFHNSFGLGFLDRLI